MYALPLPELWVWKGNIEKSRCVAELWVHSISGYAAELWVYSIHLLSKVPAFFKKRGTLLNGAVIRPILRVKTY